MKKGMLISFEGGEACGKTTQIKKLLRFLQENHYDVVAAKEPGGTPIGEEIRNLLLHSKNEISSRTEMLLFNASRCQLVSDVIMPALREGEVVILDRFFDSTLAYQGFAGNVKLEEIKPIIDFATEASTIVPDVTFLLDISFDDAMQRKNADEALKNLDRIENKKRQYHEKVREGFLTLAKESPERFVVIDARKSIEEIFDNIVKEFEKRYKQIQNEK